MSAVKHTPDTDVSYGQLWREVDTGRVVTVDQVEPETVYVHQCDENGNRWPWPFPSPIERSRFHGGKGGFALLPKATGSAS